MGADGDLYRYEAVERHVLDMIKAGEIGRGARIPSLRSMGSRLGVSISTVNQAYMELERRGVVEARPKSGFYVRDDYRSASCSVPEPAKCCGEPVDVNRTALIHQVLGTFARTDLAPLGVAQVQEEMLPVKTLGRLMSRVVSRDPLAATRYEVVSGDEGLRRQIALRMAALGAPARPERMIITVGAMEALYIALRSVTRPGDNVVIASPSYYCFLQLLENIGLRAIEIPSRPGVGVDPDDLERVVAKFNVKACILNTNFNNPDGALIPDENKEKIVGILARKGAPLIEDDVYGDLWFGRLRPKTCKTFDKKGLVMYCSSFSKTLCPGYRVGWIEPGAFFREAFEIKATTTVASSTPAQLTVAEYLREDRYDRHLRTLRSPLSRQAGMMAEEVVRYFPDGVRVTRPAGGVVLWVKLPGGADAGALFYEARKNGVSVAPGNIFSTRDRYGNFLRLCFGLPWSEDVEDAVKMLGDIAWRLVGA